MTTYESTSLHIEDEQERSLAFSTVNRDGETAVLRAWSTQTLQDGQSIEVEVLFTSNDVRDLQSFLVDTLGRIPKTDGGGVAERMSAPLAEYDPSLPIVPGMAYATGPEGIPAAAFEHLGEQPRQCPYISNGVQCTRAEGHGTTDGLSHYLPGQPMNDAGTTTPPADAQDATAPAPLAGFPGSQPDEKPKRKRRLKTEIAFDDALANLQTVPQGGEQWNEAMGAMNAAREALRVKDPGNVRLNESAAPQTPNALPAAQTGPAFAPEQAAPAASYLQQEASPINQEFATWANGIPGQHVQDSVVVSTPEQTAAQGFPCPQSSTDGRACLRPFGHEISNEHRPASAHVYATDPATLGQQPVQGFVAGGLGEVQPMPWAPAGTVNDQYLQPGQQAQPQALATGPLSFQVPPTPDPVQVAPGTDLQPPAPAMPSWQQPQ